MITLGHLGPPVAAAFLASFVEFVEALTVILAVGAVRGWKSALAGAAGGVAVLALLVAILGPALMLIPLWLVQICFGSLVLLFGMRWLRKAALRAAGAIALRDEAAAYAAHTAALRERVREGDAAGWDPSAMATTFNITLLEGLEVVFIVVAVGAGGIGFLAPAALAAVAALVAVAAIGLAVRGPLSKVPENTLKFCVGVLLSSFGAFWFGEGIGVAWPGGDWSILGLVLGFALAALGWVAWRRQSRPALAS